MKGKFSARVATVVVFLLLWSTLTAGAYQLSPGRIAIDDDAVQIKNLPVGTALSFNKEDFTGADKGKTVVFLELPPVTAGTLQLSGKDVIAFEKISAKQLDKLAFCPAKDFSGTVSIVYKVDESRPHLISCLFSSKPDLVPTADPVNVSTLKNIACTGRFDAYDNEGPVKIEITKAPKKGDVTLSENTTSFIYQPGEDKTGNDQFRYVAIDSVGNRSEEATVKVRIDKQSSELSYADLTGSFAEAPALKLAENGILAGETLAGESFFVPAGAVSRGDFFVMSMKASGKLPADTENAELTADREVWTSNYVATASSAGLITGDEKGALRISENITRGEAAVMLARLIDPQDSNAPVSFTDEVPDWASDSVAKLSAAGIFFGYEDGTFRASQTLSRAEAASLLSRTLDYQATAEKSTGVFHWFSNN